MNLLFVSMESAVQSLFINYIQGLQAMGQVDYIFWDEAHIIPLTRHYRQVMEQAHVLMTLPVPMVFASATLSHDSLSTLKKMMFLDQPVIIKGSIHQPWISYRVQEIKPFTSRQ